jgi:hypothetical protein
MVEATSSAGSVIVGYIGPVIWMFIAGIVPDVREKCVLASGTHFPTKSDIEHQNAFLGRFVQENLKEIASYEYEMWLNGRMPFVTFREIQLWRLRQFVEFIWHWCLPDDDLIAAIFNLTKRQASNLTKDFRAKFGKIYLLPYILTRWFKILDEEPLYEEVRSDVSGAVWAVPSHSYLIDINAVILELQGGDFMPTQDLVEAKSVRRSERLVWLSMDVAQQLRAKDTRDRLLGLHPFPEQRQ